MRLSGHAEIPSVFHISCLIREGTRRYKEAEEQQCSQSCFLPLCVEREVWLAKVVWHWTRATPYLIRKV